ncbi:MAG: hypothetical protein CVV28_12040 [Methanobacteriales archaeon HGW-Methanobacteriales-1]|jgi:hypothetical protein|nr:MAG: hypothetical protein CVV28_12040 [Methanobacteriales archaeon HGW-Methanobacteriales-1]
MGPTELIRRVFTIQILLDRKPKKQSEILEKLNYYINAKDFVNNVKRKQGTKKSIRRPGLLYGQLDRNKRTLIKSKDKITPAMISNLGRSLENDGIISIIPKRSDGRGGNSNDWILNENEEVLNIILSETTDSRIDTQSSLFFSSNILYSEYGKSLINMSLVESLNSDKYELDLDPSDFEIILKLIKISPQALLFLFSVKNDEKLKSEESSNQWYRGRNGGREFFMYNLMIKLGEDLNKPGFISPYFFEFDMKIKFSKGHKLKGGIEHIILKENEVESKENELIISTTPFISSMKYRFIKLKDQLLMRHYPD